MTKNSNSEILTKNLLTFKRKDGVKVELSRLRKFLPNQNFPQPCSKKTPSKMHFKIAKFVFLKNRLISKQTVPGCNVSY